MSKQQQDEQTKLRKRLETLLKQPDNQICSDCKKRGPRWASANLGVFMCIECSGIHRNLGVHISFVRSVNLDSWTEKQVAFMEQWGNGRANALYEANVHGSVIRPKEGDSVRVVEKFIREKYEAKRFIASDAPPPRPQGQQADNSHYSHDNNNGNSSNNNGRNDDDNSSFRTTNPRGRDNNARQQQPPNRSKAQETNLIDFLDMNDTPSTPQQPTHQAQQFDMFNQPQLLQQQQQTPMSPSDIFGGFSTASNENFPTTAPPPVPFKQQVSIDSLSYAYFC